MKKLLLTALIAIGLNANAQRTTPITKKIPVKTNSATPKIIAPFLKPLESLSDIQIANALYVELDLDNNDGTQNEKLKHYMQSSSKIVNIAGTIYDNQKYYLVDRLYHNDDNDDNGDNDNYGNNYESYEDKGSFRATVLNHAFYVDMGSPWISAISQELVNKFRVSSRDKTPIKLEPCNLSVTCQKEGDSLQETLRLGNDIVSQHFIKGTHYYVLSVDRAGKVTNVRSKDHIDNNQPSNNYNICSERLIANMKYFKFIDDLDAPTSRTYKITVTAKTRNSDSDAVKFIHKEETYLSNSDPSRKFYTDSIRITSRMNDAMKDIKLVESRRDSIRKSLAKNREDILEEFQTNYAAHVEKDRQRLLKEEWGGKLDPRANSYESKLEMIQAQAKANTNENFRNLQISSKKDFIDGMGSINEEYDRVVNIYNDLQSEYEALEK
jgi:hypothetical protein